MLHRFWLNSAYKIEAAIVGWIEYDYQLEK